MEFVVIFGTVRISIAYFMIDSLVVVRNVKISAPAADLGLGSLASPTKISSFSCRFRENWSNSRLACPFGISEPLGNPGSASDRILFRDGGWRMYFGHFQGSRQQNISHAVVDSGFHRGVRQPIILTIFSRKLHKNEEGGAHPLRPLRSATAINTSTSCCVL